MSLTTPPSEWTSWVLTGDTEIVAKTTITQISDDLDGSQNASEIAFSYAGVDYTIDLGKKNAAGFEKVLKPYLEAATKVSRRSSTRRSKPAVSSTKRDLSQVREWAKAQGLEVSERGRISTVVLEQYDAAH